MRILIVDDERPARDKLRRMLAQEPDVTAIEEARDGVEALEQAASFAPDVIFLDVQMPEVSGLEVAASLPHPAPLVVFATAFDEFAVPAFDANAIDYLLKPFDAARLQRAMQRLRERLASRAAHAPRTPGAIGLPLQQLLVSERGGTRVVPVAAIQWLETADNYVALHTAQGAPLLRQTLTDLLDSLGNQFMRCHRRAAVRLALVERIDQDGQLVLRNGTLVPLGRNFKPAILQALTHRQSR
ncbi:two component transcriptional regulator, LytTR family [Duganella sp. CF458]|uniref:LytR/AlgR family response regulator transcription factor n=1 Tax=Duganella sp. CF458 TaxID=1884368 RepID=UPI0008E08344|nr:response regulator [Duganella sp. CF458]SFF77496.1 two component transcriptional regulator, LytTR family [Duganella sp. CF458]